MRPRLNEALLSFLLLTFVALFTSCSGNGDVASDSTFDLKTGLSIKNNSVSDISSASVVLSANVSLKDSSNHIIREGFCYDTNSNPSIDNNMIAFGNKVGSFSGKLGNLKQNTKYYVRAFAENNKGLIYGEEINFTTTELIQPQNVNSFNITVSNKKRAVSAVYSAPMKQYLVTYQTYSEVKFSWICNDSKVLGLIALSRYAAIENGIPYTGTYKLFTFNPSGTRNFPQWTGLTGYYQLYIWSYDNKYIYSDNYFLAEAYIEPQRTYKEWSSSPNGN